MNLNVASAATKKGAQLLFAFELVVLRVFSYTIKICNIIGRETWVECKDRR